ncbi:MAG: GNAT family N-acetyltransferase [Pseudoflavonifractor sp.]|nr:GNAT family N-acetyltransferase [Alloprevotella sp.]MCM1116528.1 GNAT family N-acetyltransferase [Pseudoflavonifractor sp.]
MADITLYKLPMLTEPVIRLYLEAFPPEERRPVHLLSRLVEDATSPMTLWNIASSEGRSVGFLTLWRLPSGMTYIEHFAVNPAARGEGIGARVLSRLDELTGCGPVVIEVERPIDEMARRRIGFYERSGFVVHEGYDYAQPPYSRALPEVGMLLMTRGQIGERPIEDIGQELRRIVYLNPDDRPCGA